MGRGWDDRCAWEIEVRGGRNDRRVGGRDEMCGEGERMRYVWRDEMCREGGRRGEEMGGDGETCVGRKGGMQVTPAHTAHSHSTPTLTNDDEAHAERLYA